MHIKELDELEQLVVGERLNDDSGEDWYFGKRFKMPLRSVSRNTGSGCWALSTSRSKTILSMGTMFGSKIK